MPTINNQSIISDSTLRFKHLLASGITDPISATRTTSFVMTSWPERKIEFPLITVRTNLGVSERLGMQSEGQYLPILVFIDVWSKNVRERDVIAGSVFEILRQNQYGTDSTGNTGSGTILERLYDFRLLNMVDLDEPGKEGIHRKSIQAQYKYVTI
jgi:hypothetical protein